MSMEYCPSIACVLKFTWSVVLLIHVNPVTWPRIFPAGPVKLLISARLKLDWFIGVLKSNFAELAAIVLYVGRAVSTIGPAAPLSGTLAKRTFCCLVWRARLSSRLSPQEK